MDTALRMRVAVRAGNRCEFCLLPEEFSPVTFHIDHIIRSQHGGSDKVGNLCYSCSRCNLSKGPNLSGISPESGRIVALFNPRRHSWRDHFRWQSALIVGITPTGKATVNVLQMNAPRRVQLRSRLLARGLFR